MSLQTYWNKNVKGKVTSCHSTKKYLQFNIMSKDLSTFLFRIR